MNNILQIARPEICALTPYSSARSESIQQNIMLDANENPFSPIADEKLNRYPEPQPKSLRRNFRKLYNVSEEQLLITRGSDEGIDLLVRAFCRAGQDSVMICPPTYGMYEVAAGIQGAGVVSVPLLKENEFALDVSSIISQWQPAIKIIFLCSPNNPTGNLLDIKSILRLCEQFSSKALIVVDEAYVEFSKNESLSRYISIYSNLIVLRTLSKAYAMAGVRCGSLLANSQIIDLLKKIIAPYPLPRPTITTVKKILTDEYLMIINEKINLLIIQREELRSFLLTLPEVKKVYPSSANFLLTEVLCAKNLLKKCANNGVAIRNRSQMLGLENCVRISIGSPQENQQLKEVLAND